MENLPNRLEQVVEIDSKQTIKQYPIGGSNTATEFIIPHCDHTIASIIAEEMRQFKSIQYVAIRQPHPLETSMYLRVEKVFDEQTVQDLFIEAVKNAKFKIDTVIDQYKSLVTSRE